ncbi:MAG: hypothetical protein PUP46_07050 [Endozoicomonas sp. (ex Botrylloides leachii)]|nr:hypothetical protein [Endozoicomonas sp. (ex Botrylloides leachii)]
MAFKINAEKILYRQSSLTTLLSWPSASEHQHRVRHLRKNPAINHHCALPWSSTTDAHYSQKTQLVLH